MIASEELSLATTDPGDDFPYVYRGTRAASGLASVACGTVGVMQFAAGSEHPIEAAGPGCR